MIAVFVVAFLVILWICFIIWHKSNINDNEGEWITLELLKGRYTDQRIYVIYKNSQFKWIAAGFYEHDTLFFINENCTAIEDKRPVDSFKIIEL